MPHDHADLPPAILQALHLIGTAPPGSRTQCAAAEVLACYLRMAAPPPPPGETPAALQRLASALRDQVIATGDSWAAFGLSYADMGLAGFSARASAAPVPPRPRSPAAAGSSE